MQWLMNNWVAVLTCVLAIDQSLIPLFPQVTLFQKLKSFLGGVVPPQK